MQIRCRSRSRHHEWLDWPCYAVSFKNQSPSPCALLPGLVNVCVPVFEKGPPAELVAPLVGSIQMQVVVPLIFVMSTVGLLDVRPRYRSARSPSAVEAPA